MLRSFVLSTDEGEHIDKALGYFSLCSNRNIQRKNGQQSKRGRQAHRRKRSGDTVRKT